MKVQTGACKDATSTVLTASANPSSLGQQVVFTAKVTSGAGTPTGNVVFSKDGTTLATSPLNNGVATFSISTLDEGEHVIQAVYNGTDTFEGSQATRVQEVVDDRTATTVMLNAAPNPAVPGEQIVFTATVSAGAGTPTGNVVFSKDGNTLGTSPLNNGVATFTTSTLGAGQHTIEARYEGNNDFKPGTGSTTVRVGSQGAGTIYLPIVTR
jgi:flagellar hook assembly protein FlgD